MVYIYICIHNCIFIHIHMFFYDMHIQTYLHTNITTYNFLIISLLLVFFLQCPPNQLEFSCDLLELQLLWSFCFGIFGVTTVPRLNGHPVIITWLLSRFGVSLAAETRSSGSCACSSRDTRHTQAAKPSKRRGGKKCFDHVTWERE